MQLITIGLVDDHQLFTKSLVLMLESFEGCTVILEAGNGNDLIAKLQGKPIVPDIMLVDVNMPYMDGHATVTWLHQHYPAMHLVALSMNDTDKSIINMIRAGCCAYLLKDTHPNVLETAIREIYQKGYYNADASNINFRRLLQAQEKERQWQLSERELVFLQHACSEKTYKQIAADMAVSERTVDGYRESLFAKMGVQSRVGLCLEALRTGLVNL